MKVTMVTKRADTIEEGIGYMIEAAIENYTEYRTDMEKSYADEWSQERMKEDIENYTNSIQMEKRRKYHRVRSGGNQFLTFVCAVDVETKEGKFRKGDVLMSAGADTPAMNKARGNVLTGGYPITWQGALYLVETGIRQWGAGWMNPSYDQVMEAPINADGDFI